MTKSSRSITIRPLGGLGNQLFIYAAGRALAKRLGLELHADLSQLDHDEKRDFGLGSFSSRIDKTFASFQKRSSHGRPSNWFRHFASGGKSEEVVFAERGFWFDDRFERISGPVILEGFFQSWKYFRQIETELRSELERINSPSEWFKEEAIRVKNRGPWASIHIRRSDYREVEGMRVASDAYYGRAISVLNQLVGDINLLIFSDDYDVPVRPLERYRRGSVSFVVSPPDTDPIEHLNLMALSHHSIIANSTFSWWGAWMGHRDSRHVIHPRPWVDFKSVNDRDLHLPSWIGVGRDEERDAPFLNVVN